MDENEILFSVIIPIYNTEQYLNECIDSVISQSIGFEHIQLILVNSASEDGSAEICREYVEQYSDHIHYIELEENKGPSFPRNIAIPYVQGKYTVFLDSDDKFAGNAFEKAYKFFEEHYDEIDVVACRIKNFDAYGGWHALDYVFSSDRIVNIHDEYCNITSTIHAIFKSEAIQNLRMDESITHCEDTKFITELILKKGKYGTLRSVVYLYRRRRMPTSIVQTVKVDPCYYNDYIDKLYLYLFELSNKLYGKIIPYVQYVAMYSLQWRLLDQLPAWMSEDERTNYNQKIKEILCRIDDYIINEQRNIYKEYKIYCLRLKYGDDIYSQFQLISGKFIFHNLCWCETGNRAILNYWWHGVDANGIMRLTGEINFPFPKDTYSIFARDNLGNCYPFEYDENMEKSKQSLGEACLIIRPFELRMPLEGVSRIELFLRYQNAEFPLFINAGRFSLLSRNPPESYCRIRGYLFSCTDRAILVEKDNPQIAKKHKRALWRGLMKRKDKRAIACRLCAAVLRRFSGRQDIRILFGNDRII